MNIFQVYNPVWAQVSVYQKKKTYSNIQIVWSFPLIRCHYTDKNVASSNIKHDNNSTKLLLLCHQLSSTNCVFGIFHHHFYIAFCLKHSITNNNKMATCSTQCRLNVYNFILILQGESHNHIIWNIVLFTPEYNAIYNAINLHNKLKK